MQISHRTLSSVFVLVLLAMAGCTPVPDSGGPPGDSEPVADTDTDVDADSDTDADADADADSDADSDADTDACGDDLSGSAPVAGPQGLMIQAHTSSDLCALERALDHACEDHRGGGAGTLRDLVLTDVVLAVDGAPSEVLNTDVLELVVEYWDCWDNVFFGTIPEVILDDPYDASTIESESARWTWLYAARRVGADLDAWLDANAPGRPWHGYISYEAHLEAMTDTSYRAAYEALLLQHSNDLNALNPGMAQAWSPTFWVTPGAANTSSVRAAIADLLEGVPRISWLLIQDHLGVDTSWDCHDALGWLAVVEDAGPHLASVQLNVEYFTVDSMGIHDGDASEIAARVACYQAAGASLGASFEWRYWYGVHGH